jgi:hypothetical protein
VGRQAGLAAVGGLNPKVQCRECKYLLHCHGDITATTRKWAPSCNGWEVKTGTKILGPPPSLPECHSSMGLRKRQGEQVLSPRGPAVLSMG